MPKKKLAIIKIECLARLFHDIKLYKVEPKQNANNK